MKVELSLYASKLKNVAGALKGTSDPFGVVTQLASSHSGGAHSKPHVLGKTEVVKNNLSPQWAKVFTVDYTMGTPTKVCVSIFDEVKKGSNKSMGSALFDIGELLGARGNTKAKKLKNGGTIFATVRKAKGSGLLRLQLSGSKLKNVEGMFSKSDPFFEVHRKISAAGGLTWDVVYRSNSIKKTLEPKWEAAVLDLSTLCGGDLDLPLKISVFDYESSGKHKAMGSVEMSVNGLQKASSVKLMQKGKEVGTLHIVRAEVSGVEQVTEQMAATSIAPAPAAAAPTAGAPAAAPRPFLPSSSAAAGTPDFVDYVTGGCELNVIVAIDFTGSNGDPRKPGTLHHLDPHSNNDYEKAISAILKILSKYDSDQKFPVLGFGAKYGGVVRHCFQVAEEAHGAQGVLTAYNQVFKSGLIMSGPTVFTECMETAAAKAQSSLEQAQRVGGQSYTILLILSDGAVSDVSATAACLDRISNAPLSVVIVGVGNADFSGMQFLDDAAGHGKRDIAQFVQFNKHAHSSVSLTSSTLEEIPDQLVEYFTRANIPPHPPLQRTPSKIIVEDEEEEIDLSLDITEEEIVVTGGGDGFVDGFTATRTRY